MNSITITGALGRDSELKTTAAGKAVLNFSVANNTGYGDNKKTTWFRCTMWGARAEKLQQHFLKGTKLLVIGEFELREYEKKDGSAGTSAEIFVKDFEFIGGKNDAADNGEQSQAVKDANDVFGGEASDAVPF